MSMDTNADNPQPTKAAMRAVKIPRPFVLLIGYLMGMIAYPIPMLWFIFAGLPVWALLMWVVELRWIKESEESNA